MAHVLITGMTMSGKTTLARELARQYQAQGVPVIVLDPIRDVQWTKCADYVTDDSADFMGAVMASQSCAVMVDEAGEAVGQYAREMFALATRARHLGHRSHFITQRPAQINPTVRDQCSRLYMFALNADASKLLSRDWNSPAILKGPELDQGEYISVPRFGEPRFSAIF